jgi:transcription elongation factor Elf1
MGRVPSILATLFALVEDVRVVCVECGTYFGMGSEALFDKVNHVCEGVENVDADRNGAARAADPQND